MADKETIEIAKMLVGNQIDIYDNLLNEIKDFYSSIEKNISNIQSACPHGELEVTYEESSDVGELIFRYKYTLCKLCKKELRATCNDQDIKLISYI